MRCTTRVLKKFLPRPLVGIERFQLRHFDRALSDRFVGSTLTFRPYQLSQCGFNDAQLVLI